MKLKAFTLMEILVTIGVIGIVSALTIPNLVNNNQKRIFVNQLRKFDSELSNAVSTYISENKAAGFSETPLVNNVAELKIFFKTNFKVVDDCGGTYAPCFAETYKTLDGNTTINTRNWKCNTTLLLANGVAVCADVSSEGVTQNSQGEDINNGYNSQDYGLISLEIDLNGVKGPNIYGRDFFSISIGENGELYDPYYNKNGLRQDAAMSGAFGKIKNDNWHMNY